MRAPSLVWYSLLVWLGTECCAGSRQSRKMKPRALGRSPWAGHRSPRAPEMEPLINIPLINIDGSVMGVFDSLVGLGERESSYSVLPGESRAAPWGADFSFQNRNSLNFILAPLPHLPAAFCSHFGVGSMRVFDWNLLCQVTATFLQYFWS